MESGAESVNAYSLSRNSNILKFSENLNLGPRCRHQRQIGTAAGPRNEKTPLQKVNWKYIRTAHGQIGSIKGKSRLFESSFKKKENILTAAD